jgi:hypothetical protein
VPTDEQPEIKLSNHDLRKCISFTNMYENERKERGAQEIYGNHTDKESRKMILQGYLGECAVGLYFDYSIVYKTYNKKIADVLGYEVRTVKHSNAILITHDEDLDADYICVSINFKTMMATLKGWSSLQRTFIKSNWQDGPKWHTPCYGMPESQLWPMDTLLATPELIAHQQTVYA